MQIRTKVLSVSLSALALACTQAWANPTGGTVVNGSVSMTSTGNTLTITNSPNAIINWQGFSIAAGETTRFVQQSASSAVLNRVASSNVSSILGTLQSNGRVFLVNPNGILFSSGARVDTAAFTGTTGTITDAAFLAGNTTPTGGGSTISVDALLTIGSEVSIQPSAVGITVAAGGGILTPGNLLLDSRGQVTVNGTLSVGGSTTINAGDIVVGNPPVVPNPGIGLPGTGPGEGIKLVIGNPPTTLAPVIDGGGTVSIKVPATFLSLNAGSIATLSSNIAGRPIPVSHTSNSLEQRIELTQVPSAMVTSVISAAYTNRSVTSPARNLTVSVNLQKREPVF